MFSYEQRKKTMKRRTAKLQFTRVNFKIMRVGEIKIQIKPMTLKSVLLLEIESMSNTCS